MLGKIVKVNITIPCNSYDIRTGIRYIVNFGTVDIQNEKNKFSYNAYVLGVNHPVRVFEGRIIGVIRYFEKNKKPVLVVAPKKMRRIDHEIRDVLSFIEDRNSYRLDCLYEHSCGAVVFRKTNHECRFLLIKNRKSCHWGFPKGHIEKGEQKQETAIREVLEETGVHITLLDGFCETSDYKIGTKIEKRVDVFLGETKDTKTIIQKEEIDNYLWLKYPEAIKTLKYDNDKDILNSVREFMLDKGIFFT